MKKFRSKKLLLIFSVFAVILLGALDGVYLYNKNHLGKKIHLDFKIPNLIPNIIKQDKKNETGVFGDDLKALVNRINGLIELPANELPNIATVTNKDRLKDQPFFDKAENGDKVLLYTRAKWGVIYRPSVNKIIEAMSVDVRLNQDQDIVSSATESGVMRNGSGSAEMKVLLKENK